MENYRRNCKESNSHGDTKKPLTKKAIKSRAPSSCQSGAIKPPFLSSKTFNNEDLASGRLSKSQSSQLTSNTPSADGQQVQVTSATHHESSIPLDLSDYLHDTSVWEAMEIRFLDKGKCTVLRPHLNSLISSTEASATSQNTLKIVNQTDIVYSGSHLLDSPLDIRRQKVCVEKVHVRNLLNTKREKCGNLSSSRLSEYMPNKTRTSRCEKVNEEEEVMESSSDTIKPSLSSSSNTESFESALDSNVLVFQSVKEAKNVSPRLLTPAKKGLSPNKYDGDNDKIVGARCRSGLDYGNKMKLKDLNSRLQMKMINTDSDTDSADVTNIPRKERIVDASQNPVKEYYFQGERSHTDLSSKSYLNPPGLSQGTMSRIDSTHCPADLSRTRYDHSNDSFIACNEDLKDKRRSHVNAYYRNASFVSDSKESNNFKVRNIVHDKRSSRSLNSSGIITADLGSEAWQKYCSSLNSSDRSLREKNSSLIELPKKRRSRPLYSVPESPMVSEHTTTIYPVKPTVCVPQQAQSLVYDYSIVSSVSTADKSSHAVPLQTKLTENQLLIGAKSSVSTFSPLSEVEIAKYKEIALEILMQRKKNETYKTDPKKSRDRTSPVANKRKKDHKSLCKKSIAERPMIKLTDKSRKQRSSSTGRLPSSGHAEDRNIFWASQRIRNQIEKHKQRLQVSNSGKKQLTAEQKEATVSKKEDPMMNEADNSHAKLMQKDPAKKRERKKIARSETSFSTSTLLPSLRQFEKNKSLYSMDEDKSKFYREHSISNVKSFQTTRASTPKSEWSPTTDFKADAHQSSSALNDCLEQTSVLSAENIIEVQQTNKETQNEYQGNSSKTDSKSLVANPINSSSVFASKLKENDANFEMKKSPSTTKSTACQKGRPQSVENIEKPKESLVEKHEMHLQASKPVKYIDLLQNILRSPTSKTTQALNMFLEKPKALAEAERDLDITVDQIINSYQEILEELRYAKISQGSENPSLRDSSETVRHSPEKCNAHPDFLSATDTYFQPVQNVSDTTSESDALKKTLNNESHLANISSTRPPLQVALHAVQQHPSQHKNLPDGARPLFPRNSRLASSLNSKSPDTSRSRLTTAKSINTFVKQQSAPTSTWTLKQKGTAAIAMQQTAVISTKIKALEPNNPLYSSHESIEIQNQVSGSSKPQSQSKYIKPMKNNLKSNVFTQPKMASSLHSYRTNLTRSPTNEGMNKSSHLQKRESISLKRKPHLNIQPFFSRSSVNFSNTSQEEGQMLPTDLVKWKQDNEHCKWELLLQNLQHNLQSNEQEILDMQQTRPAITIIAPQACLNISSANVPDVPSTKNSEISNQLKFSFSDSRYQRRNEKKTNGNRFLPSQSQRSVPPTFKGRMLRTSFLKGIIKADNSENGRLSNTNIERRENLTIASNKSSLTARKSPDVQLLPADNEHIKIEQNSSTEKLPNSSFDREQNETHTTSDAGVSFSSLKNTPMPFKTKQVLSNSKLLVDNSEDSLRLSSSFDSALLRKKKPPDYKKITLPKTIKSECAKFVRGQFENESLKKTLSADKITSHGGVHISPFKQQKAISVFKPGTLHFKSSIRAPIKRITLKQDEGLKKNDVKNILPKNESVTMIIKNVPGRARQRPAFKAARSISATFVDEKYKLKSISPLRNASKIQTLLPNERRISQHPNTQRSTSCPLGNNLFDRPWLPRKRNEDSDNDGNKAPQRKFVPVQTPSLTQPVLGNYLGQNNVKTIVSRTTDNSCKINEDKKKGFQEMSMNLKVTANFDKVFSEHIDVGKDLNISPVKDNFKAAGKNEDLADADINAVEIINVKVECVPSDAVEHSSSKTNDLTLTNYRQKLPALPIHTLSDHGGVSSQVKTGLNTRIVNEKWQSTGSIGRKQPCSEEESESEVLSLQTMRRHAVARTCEMILRESNTLDKCPISTVGFKSDQKVTHPVHKLSDSSLVCKTTNKQWPIELSSRPGLLLSSIRTEQEHNGAQSTLSQDTLESLAPINGETGEEDEESASSVKLSCKLQTYKDIISMGIVGRPVYDSENTAEDKDSHMNTNTSEDLQEQHLPFSFTSIEPEFMNAKKHFRHSFLDEKLLTEERKRDNFVMERKTKSTKELQHTHYYDNRLAFRQDTRNKEFHDVSSLAPIDETSRARLMKSPEPTPRRTVCPETQSSENKDRLIEFKETLSLAEAEAIKIVNDRYESIGVKITQSVDKMMERKSPFKSAFALPYKTPNPTKDIKVLNYASDFNYVGDFLQNCREKRGSLEDHETNNVHKLSDYILDDVLETAATIMISSPKKFDISKNDVSSEKNQNVSTTSSSSVTKFFDDITNDKPKFKYELDFACEVSPNEKIFSCNFEENKTLITKKCEGNSQTCLFEKELFEDKLDVSSVAGEERRETKDSSQCQSISLRDYSAASLKVNALCQTQLNDVRTHLIVDDLRKCIMSPEHVTPTNSCLSLSSLLPLEMKHFSFKVSSRDDLQDTAISSLENEKQTLVIINDDAHKTHTALQKSQFRHLEWERPLYRAPNIYLTDQLENDTSFSLDNHQEILLKVPICRVRKTKSENLLPSIECKASSQVLSLFASFPVKTEIKKSEVANSSNDMQVAQFSDQSFSHLEHLTKERQVDNKNPIVTQNQNITEHDVENMKKFDVSTCCKFYCRCPNCWQESDEKYLLHLNKNDDSDVGLAPNQMKTCTEHDIGAVRPTAEAPTISQGVNMRIKIELCGDSQAKCSRCDTSQRYITVPSAQNIKELVFHIDPATEQEKSYQKPPFICNHQRLRDLDLRRDQGLQLFTGKRYERLNDFKSPIMEMNSDDCPYSCRQHSVPTPLSSFDDRIISKEKMWKKGTCSEELELDYKNVFSFQGDPFQEPVMFREKCKCQVVDDDINSSVSDSMVYCNLKCIRDISSSKFYRGKNPEIYHNLCYNTGRKHRAKNYTIRRDAQITVSGESLQSLTDQTSAEIVSTKTIAPNEINKDTLQTVHIQSKLMSQNESIDEVNKSLLISTKESKHERNREKKVSDFLPNLPTFSKTKLRNLDNLNSDLKTLSNVVLCSDDAADLDLSQHGDKRDNVGQKHIKGIANDATTRTSPLGRKKTENNEDSCQVRKLSRNSKINRLLIEKKSMENLEKFLMSIEEIKQRQQQSSPQLKSCASPFSPLLSRAVSLPMSPVNLCSPVRSNISNNTSPISHRAYDCFEFKNIEFIRSPGEKRKTSLHLDTPKFPVIATESLGYYNGHYKNVNPPVESEWFSQRTGSSVAEKLANREKTNNACNISSINLPFLTVAEPNNDNRSYGKEKSDIATLPLKQHGYIISEGTQNPSCSHLTCNEFLNLKKHNGYQHSTFFDNLNDKTASPIVLCNSRKVDCGNELKTKTYTHNNPFILNNFSNPFLINDNTDAYLTEDRDRYLVMTPSAKEDSSLVKRKGNPVCTHSTVYMPISETTKDGSKIENDSSNLPYQFIFTTEEIMYFSGFDSASHSLKQNKQQYCDDNEAYLTCNKCNDNFESSFVSTLPTNSTKSQPLINLSEHNKILHKDEIKSTNIAFKNNDTVQLCLPGINNSIKMTRSEIHMDIFDADVLTGCTPKKNLQTSTNKQEEISCQITTVTRDSFSLLKRDFNGKEMSPKKSESSLYWEDETSLVINESSSFHGCSQTPLLPHRKKYYDVKHNLLSTRSTFSSNDSRVFSTYEDVDYSFSDSLVSHTYHETFIDSVAVLTYDLITLFFSIKDKLKRQRLRREKKRKLKRLGNKKRGISGLYHHAHPLKKGRSIRYRNNSSFDRHRFHINKYSRQPYNLLTNEQYASSDSSVINFKDYSSFRSDSTDYNNMSSFCETKRSTFFSQTVVHKDSNPGDVKGNHDPGESLFAMEYSNTILVSHFMETSNLDESFCLKGKQFNLGKPQPVEKEIAKELIITKLLENPSVNHDSIDHACTKYDVNIENEDGKDAGSKQFNDASIVSSESSTKLPVDVGLTTAPNTDRTNCEIQATCQYECVNTIFPSPLGSEQEENNAKITVIEDDTSPVIENINSAFSKQSDDIGFADIITNNLEFPNEQNPNFVFCEHSQYQWVRPVPNMHALLVLFGGPEMYTYFKSSDCYDINGQEFQDSVPDVREYDISTEGEQDYIDSIPKIKTKGFLALQKEQQIHNNLVPEVDNEHMQQKEVPKQKREAHMACNTQQVVYQNKIFEQDYDGEIHEVVFLGKGLLENAAPDPELDSPQVGSTAQDSLQKTVTIKENVRLCRPNANQFIDKEQLSPPKRKRAEKIAKPTSPVTHLRRENSERIKKRVESCETGAGYFKTTRESYGLHKKYLKSLSHKQLNINRMLSAVNTNRKRSPQGLYFSPETLMGISENKKNEHIVFAKCDANGETHGGVNIFNRTYSFPGKEEWQCYNMPMDSTPLSELMTEFNEEESGIDYLEEVNQVRNESPYFFDDYELDTYEELGSLFTEMQESSSTLPSQEDDVKEEGGFSLLEEIAPVSQPHGSKNIKEPEKVHVERKCSNTTCTTCAATQTIITVHQYLSDITCTTESIINCVCQCNIKDKLGYNAKRTHEGWMSKVANGVHVNGLNKIDSIVSTISPLLTNGFTQTDIIALEKIPELSNCESKYSRFKNILHKCIKSNSFLCYVQKIVDERLIMKMNKNVTNADVQETKIKPPKPKPRTHLTRQGDDYDKRKCKQEENICVLTKPKRNISATRKTSSRVNAKELKEETTFSITKISSKECAIKTNSTKRSYGDSLSVTRSLKNKPRLRNNILSLRKLTKDDTFVTKKYISDSEGHPVSSSSLIIMWSDTTELPTLENKEHTAGDSELSSDICTSSNANRRSSSLHRTSSDSSRHRRLRMSLFSDRACSAVKINSDCSSGPGLLVKRTTATDRQELSACLGKPYNEDEKTFKQSMTPHLDIKVSESACNASSASVDYGRLKNILSTETKMLWKSLTRLEKNSEKCQICRKQYNSLTSPSADCITINSIQNNVGHNDHQHNVVVNKDVGIHAPKEIDLPPQERLITNKVTHFSDSTNPKGKKLSTFMEPSKNHPSNLIQELSSKQLKGETVSLSSPAVKELCWHGQEAQEMLTVCSNGDTAIMTSDKENFLNSLEATQFNDNDGTVAKISCSGDDLFTDSRCVKAACTLESEHLKSNNPKSTSPIYAIAESEKEDGKKAGTSLLLNFGLDNKDKKFVGNGAAKCNNTLTTINKYNEKQTMSTENETNSLYLQILSKQKYDDADEKLHCKVSGVNIVGEKCQLTSLKEGCHSAVVTTSSDLLSCESPANSIVINQAINTTKSIHIHAESTNKDDCDNQIVVPSHAIGHGSNQFPDASTNTEHPYFDQFQGTKPCNDENREKLISTQMITHYKKTSSEDTDTADYWIEKLVNILHEMHETFPNAQLEPALVSAKSKDLVNSVQKVMKSSDLTGTAFCDTESKSLKSDDNGSARSHYDLNARAEETDIGSRTKSIEYSYLLNNTLSAEEIGYGIQTINIEEDKSDHQNCGISDKLTSGDQGQFFRPQTSHCQKIKSNNAIETINHDGEAGENQDEIDKLSASNDCTKLNKTLNKDKCIQEEILGYGEKKASPKPVYTVKLSIKEEDQQLFSNCINKPSEVTRKHLIYDPCCLKASTKEDDQETDRSLRTCAISEPVESMRRLPSLTSLSSDCHGWDQIKFSPSQESQKHNPAEQTNRKDHFCVKLLTNPRKTYSKRSSHLFGKFRMFKSESLTELGQISHLNRSFNAPLEHLSFTNSLSLGKKNFVPTFLRKTENSLHQKNVHCLSVSRSLSSINMSTNVSIIWHEELNKYAKEDAFKEMAFNKVIQPEKSKVQSLNSFMESREKAHKTIDSADSGRTRKAKNGISPNVSKEYTFCNSAGDTKRNCKRRSQADATIASERTGSLDVTSPSSPIAYTTQATKKCSFNPEASPGKNSSSDESLNSAVSNDKVCTVADSNAIREVEKGVVFYVHEINGNTEITRNSRRLLRDEEVNIQSLMLPNNCDVTLKYNMRFLGDTDNDSSNNKDNLELLAVNKLKKEKNSNTCLIADDGDLVILSSKVSSIRENFEKLKALNDLKNQNEETENKCLPGFINSSKRESNIANTSPKKFYQKTENSSGNKTCPSIPGLDLTIDSTSDAKNQSADSDKLLAGSSNTKHREDDFYSIVDNAFADKPLAKNELTAFPENTINYNLFIGHDRLNVVVSTHSTKDQFKHDEAENVLKRNVSPFICDEKLDSNIFIQFDNIAQSKMLRHNDDKAKLNEHIVSRQKLISPNNLVTKACHTAESTARYREEIIFVKTDVSSNESPTVTLPGTAVRLPTLSDVVIRSKYQKSVTADTSTITELCPASPCCTDLSENTAESKKARSVNKTESASAVRQKSILKKALLDISVDVAERSKSVSRYSSPVNVSAELYGAHIEDIWRQGSFSEQLSEEMLEALCRKYNENTHCQSTHLKHQASSPEKKARMKSSSFHESNSSPRETTSDRESDKSSVSDKSQPSSWNIPDINMDPVSHPNDVTSDKRKREGEDTKECNARHRFHSLEIPVDIYTVPLRGLQSSSSQKKKKKKEITRTVVISGPLSHFNIPVYRHSKSQEAHEDDSSSLMAASSPNVTSSKKIKTKSPPRKDLSRGWMSSLKSFLPFRKKNSNKHKPTYNAR